jgi:phosphatidylserine/phosphatidylglycerophosphate/cardiolipin synthase-like enzyme
VKRAAILLLAGALGCQVAPADGGVSPRSVRLIVQPEAGPTAVLELIEAARESIWVEVYLLTSQAALAALEDRARAGVDVRVLLDAAPYRSEGGNRGAFERLAGAGVDVRWATERFRYAHAKMMVVDRARLVVMTSNLTDAGLGGNREFVVVDEDAEDVAAAGAMFEADWVGGVAAPGGRLVVSPDNTRPTFEALVDGAARTLRWQSEELAEPRMLGAFAAASGRGVAVTVVWPGPPSGASAALAETGVNVRPVAAPVSHAKAAVLDGGWCYVGSANLSPTALDTNREVGLLLRDAEVCGVVDATIAADAAIAAGP